MVAMSPPQLRTDSKTMERILQGIQNANENDLRSLWADHHGSCASWAVLLASKIAEDPNDLYFGDVGYHTMAFTRSGIFIDSHVREALQLKDGIEYNHRGITYTLKWIGQDEPIISFAVRLYSRIGRAILTRK
jgi:hypothetical protein